MDFIRLGLFFAIGTVLFLLVGQWVEFKQQQTTPSLPPTLAVPVEVAAATGSDIDQLPNTPATTADTAKPTPQKNPNRIPERRLLSIHSDVLQLHIDLLGGDIVQATLPAFPEKLDAPNKPFVLLENRPQRRYIARSGLIGTDATDTSEGRPLFRSAARHYRLDPQAEWLHVDLYYDTDEVSIRKRFSLRRADYLIKLSYHVENHRDRPWKGNLYGQIKRDGFADPRTEGSTFSPASFLGFAAYTPSTPYRKFHFEDLAEEPFEQTIEGGWVSLVQHYFVSAWIPEAEQSHRFRLSASGDETTFIGSFVSPELRLDPGASGVVESGLYIGPKDQSRLAEIAPGLALTVDYGWLWWMAQPLFQILRTIHQVVGNWGISIILLTMLIKLLFFPLSNIGYRSMARMRNLQPRLAALREQHGQDRQRMSQEMMSIYRREKINPLGGCLPILIQMPVFLALYWVLLESVELRHAPFFGWIQDLSVMDPWYVLPVLMGLSMYVQQKLNPQPPDPMQAKILLWLPAVMTVLFLFFPAGLVLYWLVNNVLSMAQQWTVNRRTVPARQNS